MIWIPSSVQIKRPRDSHSELLTSRDGDESIILCDPGHTENPSITYEHFGEFIPRVTYVRGEVEMRDDIIGQIFVVVTLAAAAALLFI